MMHRALITALAVAWLTAISTASQTFRVDAIDPAEEGEFPGGRGRNQLIIYTPAYGQPTTGTNVLGSEAVVADGLVVSLGGNDSPIPENGFVVSGNGKARFWIVGHLRPGTAVAYDEQTIWVDQSLPAQLASLRRRLEDVEGRLDAFPETQTEASEVSAICAEIAQIEDPLPGLTRRVTDLEDQAFALELAQIPSPPNEVRAVWHRFVHASPEAIATEVQAMADANINAVFTEVHFGSSVVYPDPTGTFPQIEEFRGSDPLPVFIEECHARGIEVHAWVHNFFLGREVRQGELREQFAEAHPEWVSVNRRGENELVPWGYRYLNPAHLGLHEALSEAHAAMVETYDFDGYHCDHIRYCLSLSWESGWDYSEYTRARVREELGFDPLDITPDEHPDEWSQWLGWRQEQVTSYMRRQTAAIRAVRPDILISAAVFHNLEEAIENKGQDWSAWVREGLLDAPMPMVYTPSVDEVADGVAELVVHMPADGPTVIGLGPFLGLTPRRLVEQITASRAAGATGQCFFVWHRLTDGQLQALGDGPWRSSGAPVWTRSQP